MLFSIALILIAVSVLVFAFGGIFGRFPDNWEWVGIVLAGWSIAMGAPSLFQMMLGRARLLTLYDRAVREQERSLLVFLKNPPINNRVIWNKFGLRRETIASLSASFVITEIGSNRVLTKPLVHARIFTHDEPTKTGA